MSRASIGMTRSFASGSIPIWQGLTKDIQLSQGGYLLTNPGLPVGFVIPAGTPLVFNESTRAATMVSGGVLQANASSSATTYQVLKGHTFVIGQYLSAVTGGTAYAITAIDTSNAAYDVLTVGTTLGVGYSAGQNLFASTATGSTASALPAVNGLLYDDSVVEVNTFVSAVIRGTVYARRIPYAYNTYLAALAGMDDIIFSQSK